MAVSRILALALAIGFCPTAPATANDALSPGEKTGSTGCSLYTRTTRIDIASALPGAIKRWGVRKNLRFLKNSAHSEFEVDFPKGSRSPTGGGPIGGAGFGTMQGLDRNASHVCLSYKVLFPKGFAFSRGGKLPGLFGGDAPSGGDRPKGDGGFTLRVMWRAKGDGELYLYSPNMTPSSKKGGMRLGTGSFKFNTGRWTQIDMEIRLNSPGKNDGTALLAIDEKVAIRVEGIEYRATDKIDVGGLMFSTFFGGDRPDHATPRDQSVRFQDFRIGEVTQP